MLRSIRLAEQCHTCIYHFIRYYWNQFHISWRKTLNFIAFINILWVSTVFLTPYLFLDTAARLQWPVTQISRSQQFFLNKVVDIIEISSLDEVSSDCNISLNGSKWDTWFSLYWSLVKQPYSEKTAVIC
jgi:hypothetical protein